VLTITFLYVTKVMLKSIFNPYIKSMKYCTGSILYSQAHWVLLESDMLPTDHGYIVQLFCTNYNFVKYFNYICNNYLHIFKDNVYD